MAGPTPLGAFEQLVILAVLQLGEGAYGMAVRELLEQRGRKVSLGAVYATLDRMERKGWIASHRRPGGGKRAGAARRFFEVRPAGLDLVRESLTQVRELSHGLEGVLAREPS